MHWHAQQRADTVKPGVHHNFLVLDYATNAECMCALKAVQVVTVFCRAFPAAIKHGCQVEHNME